MPQPCPVHRVPHCDGYAICVNGFIPRSGDYFESRRVRFPHANAVSFRGCTGRGSRKKVKYCPACRRELMNWCEEKVAQQDDVSGIVPALMEHLTSAAEESAG